MELEPLKMVLLIILLNVMELALAATGDITEGQINSWIAKISEGENKQFTQTETIEEQIEGIRKQLNGIEAKLNDNFLVGGKKAQNLTHKLVNIESPIAEELLKIEQKLKILGQKASEENDEYSTDIQELEKSCKNLMTLHNDHKLIRGLIEIYERIAGPAFGEEAQLKSKEKEKIQLLVGEGNDLMKVESREDLKKVLHNLGVRHIVEDRLPRKYKYWDQTMHVEGQGELADVHRTRLLNFMAEAKKLYQKLEPLFAKVVVHIHFKKEKHFEMDEKEKEMAKELGEMKDRIEMADKLFDWNNEEKLKEKGLLNKEIIQVLKAYHAYIVEEYAKEQLIDPLYKIYDECRNMTQTQYKNDYAKKTIGEFGANGKMELLKEWAEKLDIGNVKLDNIKWIGKMIEALLEKRQSADFKRLVGKEKAKYKD